MIEDKLREKANYKFKLIKELYRSESPVSNFCKEKGLKRRTLYRWLKSFNEKGYKGLIEKSKIPKSYKEIPKSYKETPKQIQRIIVELSKKLSLGSKNISHTIEPLYRISHKGVLKVLRRNGITVEKKKKRWKSFRSPYKNHTWQVDFLGPYSTIVGEISILVVLDDYSRYSRSKIVPRRGTTEHVKEFLNELIDKQGKPYRVLTNHGTQFRKVFEKWCRAKKIRHHRARVRHPQTMGKVEAVNKMLGKCFRLNFESFGEGQIKLDCVMLWYNHVHYHSVIECTPAQAYGVQKDKKEVLKEMADILHLNNLGDAIRCAIS